MPHEAAKASDLTSALAAVDYLCDERTSLVAWLALRLSRPLLLEGPAGVGKTDLARALAEALGRPLIRLQCYEGLDEGKALYEWDYAKQMLSTQLLRDVLGRELSGVATVAEAMDRLSGVEASFFSRRFLLARPLLQALTSEVPVVLLLDEVDRADPEFEAFLLELLAENQATIPELGTVRALHPPLVVLTTNGARDMTDALRRRCLHAFLDYPSPTRERAIVKRRVHGIADALAGALTELAREVRRLDLRKAPSIAETVDWARALVLLGASALDIDLARDTLGAFVKYDEDRSKVEAALPKLVTAVTARERETEPGHPKG